MKDEDKTKDQLINALVEMRQRLTELETSETRRKRAEQALKESEGKYSTLVNEINDGFVITDDRATITFANRALAKILGFQSPGELVGRTFLEFLTPEVRSERAKRFRRGIKAKKLPEIVDDPFIRKDGNIGFIELKPTPILEDGKVVGTRGIARDITERKRAEQALRESEERFRALAESATDAIISSDSRGNITFWNKGAETIFGYSAAEIVGKPVALLMPERFRDLHQNAMRQGGSTGEFDITGKTAEVAGLRKDGSEFPAELSLATWKSGEERFYTAIVRDITERKRADEALKSVALETVEAVSTIVEANDPYTAGHSAKVTELAVEIATEMGLAKDQLDTLRIAGLLHDVGKVGIPSSVLNKPAELTQAEWLMIQSHPVVSAQTAERVAAFKDAIPIIRHHHEKWDGTGYPEGLKGEEIPLLARILAAADGFEAMTSDRPYRPAMSEEEALAKLGEGAGIQWDPQIVKTFLKIRKAKAKRRCRK